MHLTLIKPNMGMSKGKVYIDEGRMEPLQIGVLAGLTPPDIDVTFYDDRMEPIDYDRPTDLVALTVETFTAKRSYQITQKYRARGVPVALGGMHVSLLPEEAKARADAIVTGDAESVWAEVLRDARAGTLKKEYRGAYQPCPQQNVVPRRDLFSRKGYLPITLMQYSRGCPYRCHFCASSAYFGARHAVRDPADVVAEIRAQKRKLIFFVDDNLVADFDAAKRLFRALIPLKIRWVSQGSIDMLQDEELMRLMVQSGCLGLVIGFESTDPENLKQMNKQANRSLSDHYAEQLEQLRVWGLQTWAAFTIGHDNDTKESIEALCDFAIRSKFTFAAFNVLMPYPGTALYERLRREERLLYDGAWWLHPAYRFNHAAYLPKKMSPDELTAAGFAARKRFNSPRSIFLRALEPRTNLSTPYRLMTYLLYNPLFRKEVFKKQDMYLGVQDDDTMDSPRCAE